VTMAPERPTTYGRVPPHNLEAEESLVGAALLSRDAITKALDAHVSETDFYKPAHGTIWRALLALFADDQPIDPVTVAAQLRHTNDLGKVGDRGTLAELAANVPASANAGFYAKVVHDTATERKVLSLTAAIEQRIYDNQSADDLIEQLTHPRTTEAHGWGPVDLAKIIGGNLQPPEPSILERDDHRHFFYAGRIHSVNGESESLKSWLALHACAQQIAAGNDVLYLDFEDTPESILGRLLALGVAGDDLLAGLVYIRPEQPLDVAAGSNLERLITKRDPALAVVDGVTEAMSLEGYDLLDNADIASWLDKLPRRIRNLGPAVVLIDHVPKNTENRRRGGIGGQHKLAGIDVSYLVESIIPLARVAPGDSDPHTGTSRITVEKDRPGGVRAFAANRKHVGELALTAYPDGGVTAHITPATELPEGGFRPTLLMERMSDALAKSKAPLTKRALRAAVKGKSEAKDLALELLVGEGYVTVEAGARGAQLHRSVRPYRAKDDDRQQELLDEEPPDDDWTDDPVLGGSP